MDAMKECIPIYIESELSGNVSRTVTLQPSYLYVVNKSCLLGTYVLYKA